MGWQPIAGIAYIQTGASFLHMPIFTTRGGINIPLVFGAEEEERRSGCQKQPTPKFALPRRGRSGRGNWFQLLCPDDVGYASLEVACNHFF
jgi:hypothetical protein